MRVSAAKRAFATRRDQQIYYEMAVNSIHADLDEQVAALERTFARSSYAPSAATCAFCAESLVKPPFGKGRRSGSSSVMVVRGEAFHEGCGKAWGFALSCGASYNEHGRDMGRYLDRLAIARHDEPPLHLVLDSLSPGSDADGVNKPAFSLRPDPDRATKIRRPIGTRTPGSLPVASIQNGSMAGWTSQPMLC